jgi:hypothetical protein
MFWYWAYFYKLLVANVFNEWPPWKLRCIAVPRIDRHWTLHRWIHSSTSRSSFFSILILFFYRLSGLRKCYRLKDHQLISWMKFAYSFFALNVFPFRSYWLERRNKVYWITNTTKCLVQFYPCSSYALFPMFRLKKHISPCNFSFSTEGE